MIMKKIVLSSITLIYSFFCLATLHAQTPTPEAEAKWVCTALNMVSGIYKGGDYANIHLAPYPYGGRYKVLEKSDSVAKGVTQNGTPFECKKIP